MLDIKIKNRFVDIGNRFFDVEFKEFNNDIKSLKENKERENSISEYFGVFRRIIGKIFRQFYKTKRVDFSRQYIKETFRKSSKNRLLRIINEEESKSFKNKFRLRKKKPVLKNQLLSENNNKKISWLSYIKKGILNDVNIPFRL